jgi:hypothetical protein
MSLASDAERLALEAQIRGLNGRITSLHHLLDAKDKTIAEVESRFDAALAIKSERFVSSAIIKQPKRKSSESTAFVLASDWHAEENVRPETINGRNSFNLAIAKRRIQRFYENVVYLIELQRKGTRIDNLVLCLLGDMMNGYIHEEYEENNELSPVETILWLYTEISAGLQYLADNGKLDRIVIPCCVGNHGRTTKKPRVGTMCKNSYEWMMYHCLAQRFPQFEWQIADGYHTYVEVYGRNVRCHHGDAIKYQGGIGGITVPVIKAIAGWDKNIHADLDLFGHWHQMVAHRKFICNGSLIGYNAYALQIKADYEPPSQTFFLMEKDHGRTITAPIVLS